MKAKESEQGRKYCKEKEVQGKSCINIAEKRNMGTGRKEGRKLGHKGIREQVRV